METPTLGLPLELTWLREPRSWSTDLGAVTIDAPARTDWFFDPAGNVRVDSAPALVGVPPDAEFTFAAEVTVDATATFDAGVLFLYANEDTWAKLCLERSPAGPLMVVSVVTRGTSDDCNSEPITGDTTWLRVARVGGAFAFHHSRDGRRWELVRHFGLPADELRIGFLAQAPTGEGCRASFANIAYEARTLADLRDGT
jgi:uncharacterized protein